jgi:hypothetical protein
MKPIAGVGAGQSGPPHADSHIRNVAVVTPPTSLRLTKFRSITYDLPVGGATRCANPLAPNKRG